MQPSEFWGLSIVEFNEYVSAYQTYVEELNGS